MNKYKNAYEIADAIIDAQCIGYDEVNIDSMPPSDSPKYHQLHDVIERECKEIIANLNKSQITDGDLDRAIFIAEADNAHEAVSIMDELYRQLVD